MAKETKAYKSIPVITDFTDKAGNNKMQEQVKLNYERIKSEIKSVVEEELERIKNDPELMHLLEGRE